MTEMLKGLSKTSMESVFRIVMGIITKLSRHVKRDALPPSAKAKTPAKSRRGKKTEASPTKPKAAEEVEAAPAATKASKRGGGRTAKVKSSSPKKETKATSPAKPKTPAKARRGKKAAAAAAVSPAKPEASGTMLCASVDIEMKQ